MMKSLNPAENLLGMTLKGGWEVIEKITLSSYSTGGNFSVCYKVKKEEKLAFLKALDLSRAFQHKHFLKFLEYLITAHNYECEILKICSTKRMSKVVAILDDGEIPAAPEKGAQIPVNYLIFELADKNVRDHLAMAKRIDNAWIMRSLHNVAVGLNQLHKNGIVHQDVKPSNVLLFNNATETKIGDLGRSESKASQSIYFDQEIAGDPSYSPPELLYHHVLPDWNVRRQACDLFHLGSLLCFYYSKTQMTSLIQSYLPSSYHWQNWSGDYLIVLPYLNEAFEAILRDMNATIMNFVKDEHLTDEIVTIIKQLCIPDPVRRGHPSNFNMGVSKYSLERYIAWFIKLARIFESKMI
jgi:eukaryotic-like serine/threonine-protein kinase